MNELARYDQMVLDQSQSNDDTSVLPLSSWDIYIKHFSILAIHKKDIEYLKKITKNWTFKRNYRKELTELKSTIVITCPQLTIVYASQNIKKMSGYSTEEVIGRTPKMFQGSQTCIKTSKRIRAAITKEESFTYTILNYKKDRSTYECIIEGHPVYDKKGKLVNYIAFEHVA